MIRVGAPDSPLAIGIDPGLASVLTDPVRVRILERLQAHPISPSRLAREIGGDVSEIARGFRYLQKYGYAERLEGDPRSRCGLPGERSYRLTANETAAPRGGMASAGDGISMPLDLDCHLSQIAKLTGVDTVEEGLESHLSWDVLLLDREGERQLRERSHLAFQPMLDDDRSTANRPGRPGGQTVGATIGFSLFRSPQPADEVLRRTKNGQALVSADRGAFEISPELANALANRWRAKILFELISRPLSPSQFVERAGGDPSYVARCFRDLEAWGLIELIEERRGGRKGGGTERIFRNARHLWFDKAIWSTVPPFVRVEITKSTFRSLCGRLYEAAQAGYLDPEAGFLLRWRSGVFDRNDWQSLNRDVDSLLEQIPRLQQESIDRVAGDWSALGSLGCSFACLPLP